MNRVSTNMANNDMQFYMRHRQWEMNNQQNRIGSNSRIHDLRDAPSSAANATRYLSRITRTQRYFENTQEVSDDLNYAYGQLESATNIIHRVRELTVQAANGTLRQEDTYAAAQEIDQYLEELLNIANSVAGDGRTAIFGGTRSFDQPFQTFAGTVPGADGQKISEVIYTGNSEAKQVEIDKGSYVDVSLPGSQVFWAEQQTVLSSIDAAGYQVQQDTGIVIDGYDIQLQAGDTVNTIIARINDSPASVKASLDPVRNSLVLTTTSAHQLRLEDRQGGQTLTDLGIVADGFGRPPNNIAASAQQSGGSLFDMVIRLRDSMYAGDTSQIGTSDLKGVDLALKSLTDSWSGISALKARVETVGKRHIFQEVNITDSLNNEVGLDVAKAITDLKMLEFNHQLSLQASARIMQRTLLDFLR